MPKTFKRYYRIGGITIQVDSDLPINEETFNSKFRLFEVEGLGADAVYLRHHFTLPRLEKQNLGEELYRRPPWAIYRKGDSWIYLGISPIQGSNDFYNVAVFNKDHTRARIYNDGEKNFLKGGRHSLTLFGTDEILLARILADREGCILHACGAVFNGEGYLFVGHTEAGKSTIAKMLKDKAEILCDDRVILRRHREDFKIYGTWNHGDVPDVSPNNAHLKAILFLEKSNENNLMIIEDKKEILKRLLACLVKPFVTVDWWEKTLSLADEISDKAPSYVLYFDKSGKVAELLKGIGEREPVRS